MTVTKTCGKKTLYLGMKSICLGDDNVLERNGKLNGRKVIDE